MRREPLFSGSMSRFVSPFTLLAFSLCATACGSSSLMPSTPKAAARREACDQDSPPDCYALAELAAGSRLAELGSVDSDVRREVLDLTHEACDRGVAQACFTLASIYLFDGGSFPADKTAQLFSSGGFRPSNVPLGLHVWEKGCRRSFRDYSGSSSYECVALRELMLDPRAPRRDRDDWLPIYAEHRDPPRPPAPLPSGGGICALDPTACPPAIVIPYPPELLARSPREYANAIAHFQAACARGDHRTCLRFIQLGEIRWTTPMQADLRNQGPPPIDAALEYRRLCDAFVGDACVELDKGRDGPEHLALVERGCAGGSPVGCALAAHAMSRARFATALVRDRYARACAGGVTWACRKNAR
jgi:hypothetical protein